MRKLLILVGLLVGISILWMGTGAKAYSFLTEDNSYLGTDQVVDGTLYATGSSVKIAGTVKGDVFCAAQTVEITGTVEGDVICGAQQITVNGTVNGDVRVAGQIVMVNGVVDGAVSAFGQTVTFGPTTTVGRDVTVGAQTAALDGRMERDIVGGANSITVSGTVGRDVAVGVEQLALTSGARVGGSVTYTSANEVRSEEGSVIGGTTVRHAPTTPQRSAEESASSRMVSTAFWFAALLIVGLAVMLLRSQLLPATAQTVRQDLWSVLGWGTLGVIAPPLLAFILFFTLIGLPLAFLLLLLWAVGLMLSVPVAGHAIGRLIISKSGVKVAEGWQQFAGLTIGLIVLLVLSLLPFVGGVIQFVAVVMGMGSLLYMAKHMPVEPKTATKAKGKLV